MRPLLVALLTTLVLGCVTPAPSDPAPDPAAAALDGLAPPTVDGARAREWWDAWVNAHPMRLAGSPTNIQASEEIAAALADAGYEARVLYYTPQGASPAAAGIRTIVGVKQGTTQPDHVVGWLSHYDSTASTIYAAYDDGSGTATTLEVARALAGYNNSKTLMAIFFDAEELGLVASQAFVQQALQDESSVFDLVVGLDMTGINCPGHEWPLYGQPGKDHAEEILAAVKPAYAKAGLDVGEGEDATNCVVLLDANDRNSDENSFREAGIPVLRFSGGRNAGDYPEYHKPGDTTQYVYDYMGGPENYEKGIAAAATATAWTVMAYDRQASG
ncbi:MAG TPA: M28 family peptidase [Candidatus Thermoplasmatota archaeon]|nr:M28 family peptidase [Candidatus Thermoplasmatota archaeon]